QRIYGVEDRRVSERLHARPRALGGSGHEGRADTQLIGEPLAPSLLEARRVDEVDGAVVERAVPVPDLAWIAPDANGIAAGEAPGVGVVVARSEVDEWRAFRRVSPSALEPIGVPDEAVRDRLAARRRDRLLSERR